MSAEPTPAGMPAPPFLAIGAIPPAVPLTTTDVPPGVKVLRGRLVMRTGPRGRPFVSLLIESCPCGCSHLYRYRMDWPATTAIVSHVQGP